MFVITLTYTKPLEAIDRHLSAHVEFLNRQYAAGIFLASGRLVPRTGGMILARAGSIDELQAVLREDPFRIHDLAEYGIAEFVPTMTAPELEAIKEQA